MMPAPSIDWAEALARRHGWLRAVARARGGELAAVDDILQEVALAAARGWQNLRDPERIEAWLYRLTVTCALQHRRRCGRQRRLAERLAERETPVAEPDPLAWLTRDEQATQVREALTRLAPKDAEILLLKYTHDWSYAQLAERLGVSPSAVDGRLQRARAALRRELARSGIAAVTT